MRDVMEYDAKHTLENYRQAASCYTCANFTRDDYPYGCGILVKLKEEKSKDDNFAGYVNVRVDDRCICDDWKAR
jgi:hypothetical protein